MNEVNRSKWSTARNPRRLVRGAWKTVQRILYIVLRSPGVHTANPDPVELDYPPSILSEKKVIVAADGVKQDEGVMRADNIETVALERQESVTPGINEIGDDAEGMFDETGSDKGDSKGESRHELMRVAEALIFASQDPVAPQRIGEIYASVTGETIPDQKIVTAAIEHLNDHYYRYGQSLRVQQWAGGYKMATDASVAPYLRAFFQRTSTKKLSRSLLETLAVIAYKQPVTKPEVDFIRGVDSDYGIRRLLEYGFIDVMGRSESLGRPLLYRTTPAFLEQFGINDLDALPTLREIEEILDDPDFQSENASLLKLDEHETLKKSISGTGHVETSIESDNGKPVDERE